MLWLISEWQRGGEGNIHRDRFGGHSQDPNRESLGDKVKEFLHLGGHKDGHKEGEKAHQEQSS